MAVNVVTIVGGRKIVRPLTKAADMALRDSAANRRHHAMAMQGDHDGKRRQSQRNYNLLLLSGKHVQGSIITDFLALQAPLERILTVVR